jgi:hypothetical protein
VNLAVFRPCQEKSNSNPVGTSLCHAPRTVAQCSSPRATTQKSVGERDISDKLLGSRIQRSPRRLLPAPPQHLALRLTAGMLTRANSIIGTEPATTDATGRLPGRRHDDPSSPRLAQILHCNLNYWMDDTILEVAPAQISKVPKPLGWPHDPIWDSTQAVKSETRNLQCLPNLIAGMPCSRAIRTAVFEPTEHGR